MTSLFLSPIVQAARWVCLSIDPATGSVVTIRLQHRIAQALRRVCLEQQLTHNKPDTQQDIVDAALTDWLLKHGFTE